ncbi:MAG TPA: radical SAM protein [Synergistaceae bacterium]|nr:radical SAM protein [Synergistaceae bacterium]HPJ26562.1 radical SAM protein [Synergistaceae bacterium]HPQ38263.1 radical SAM protein [Synergistaceae bacterium]
MMRIKKIFSDEENRKVMEINLLPSKCCNFNCVFCPIEEKGTQTDRACSFEGTRNFLSSLEERMDAEKPRVLFINSMGEALFNDQIEKVISLAKSRDIEVSLYSNGYALGNPEYARIAGICEEVAGEIKAAKEETFQKFQRPLEGYSLDAYWEGMTAFRKEYKGRFVAYVSLYKGVNDDPESLEQIRGLLEKLHPSSIKVDTPEDERFGKLFGLSPEEFERARKSILPR